MNRREFRHQRPAGMQCFAFNTRRWPFQDWRVRRALAYSFDYEWTNRNIFFNQYVRTASYFANSEMAATGLPEGDELKILERFKGRIPDRVFTEPYSVPVYNGDGDIRPGLREAFRLFEEAGWEIRDFRMVEKKSGRPLEFETFTASPEFTRIYLPMVKNLKRMGVTMRVRVVDPSQYIKRVQKFDFDMVTQVWGQSESPGNEQRDNWTIPAADEEGSYNIVGIKDKAVDELVEMIIAAPDREQLVARCKALDRVLLAGHYVIPQYHANSDRLAYWDKFGVPEPTRRGAPSVMTWWIDPAKAERLRGRIRSLPAS
jgi:microcin C transport system substrate-binding protein